MDKFYVSKKTNSRNPLDEFDFGINSNSDVELPLKKKKSGPAIDGEI